MRGRPTWTAAAVAGMLLVACSGAAGGPAPADTTGTAAAPTSTAEPTPAPPATAPGPPGSTAEPRPAPTPTPGGSIAGAPDDEALQAAREDVAELSLAQLAGQLIVAAYLGTDSSAAAAMVARHHLGGVITLGDNVPEDRSMRLAAMSDLTERVHGAVAADGRDWPAFVGIDQEGGAITRLGAPLNRWPSAMALGAAGDAELAREVSQASGEQLRALGFTVVFAPVADVTSGPDDPTIGVRSPGSDPELVARIAAAAADGFAGAGMIPVAKHFPGHGSVPVDSHLAPVRQDADLDTLLTRDLVPFVQLVQDGIPAVMTAHLVLEDLDPEHPATLSELVLTGLLREEMGFTGLVVTDALNMAAISDVYGAENAAVLAIQAGADVLLMPSDPGAAAQALVQAVQEGTLERDRLEDSASRIVATLRAVQGTVPGPEVIGSQFELSRTAAAAGITQLSGDCGQPLVGPSVQIVGGTAVDRDLLGLVAREAGLSTGAGDVVALLGAPPYQAGGGGGDGPAGQGAVVVALDVPYQLADSTATSALLAAFGRDRATFEAVVAVLQGQQPATGRLPVAVGAYAVGAGCP